MLFILDHDVSALVGATIRRAGHKCHTIGSAGLARAIDDEVSTFTADRRGILLTHDKEMIARRRKNTFGHHVLLDCGEWEAPAIVGIRLGAIITATGTRDATVMRLTKDNLRIYPSNWE